MIVKRSCLSTDLYWWNLSGCEPIQAIAVLHRWGEQWQGWISDAINMFPSCMLWILIVPSIVILSSATTHVHTY